MRTRNVNARIVICKKVGGKNEDGEIVKSRIEELFSCWAEISKATVKEFREKTSATLAGEGLKKRKSDIVFIVRYQQKQTIDSSMFIKFRDSLYEIVTIEPDYARKDFNLLGGVLVE